MQQPEWFKPSNGFDKGLKVKNSLSLKDGKMAFIPQEGNKVTWYICGPTTYDHTHLGHARTYISFDIIRRILENYFGYEVFSVMNITDVDDKIILKARKRYLYKQYREKNSSFSEGVEKEILEAWERHLVGMAKKIEKVSKDESKKENERKAEVELLENKKKEAEQDREKVKKLLSGKKDEALVEIYALSEDPMQDKLDAELGHTVVDNNIYRQLAAQYEEEYLEDMRDLNVQMPDVLTRVTEFIPEIISYVQKIIDNGFGYVSNDSVYFDTVKFSQHKDHAYGKLEPSSVGIDRLLEEGEGALSSNVVGEKRFNSDFALWKKSKQGEPSWDSPWGKGRPGWHIECSAMASSLLHFPLDIHSGGVDLKFPHHDNELAQSEAYFDQDGCKQWVNYFLHSGHLHIDGLKMSKSLKNFISIRGARKKYSATQLRLYFATRSWDGVVNYTEKEMNEVQKKESTIQIFYSIVGKALRFDNLISQKTQKWSNDELDLHKFLLTSQNVVDSAFKDNFDTPTVIAQIIELCEKTTNYVKATGEENTLKFLLSKISRFVTRILTVLGLINDKENAYTTDNSASQIDSLLDSLANFRKSIRAISIKKEENLKEYFSIVKSFTESIEKKVNVTFNDENTEWKCENKALFNISLELYVNLFSKFRRQVLNALNSNKKNFFFDILNFCDALRDQDLIPFGVKLEDDSDVLWRRVPAVELFREKELKNLKGYEKRLDQIEKELKELTEFKNPPNTIFHGKYKEFDEKGFPTLTLEGKPVSESTKKKLEKIYAKYLKSYQSVQTKLEKNPNLEAQLLLEQKELQNKINLLIN